MNPATTWQEKISPVEAERHKHAAALLTDIQRKNSERDGNGRALHRKGHLALKAELTVLADLPEHARQGLFAAPKKYEAWIRLSNGGGRVEKDRKPDIRGFAIRVLGVSGESALGGGAVAQDFVLINQETFGFKDSELFLGLVMAAQKNPLAVVWLFIRKLGFFAGLAQVKRLAANVGRPFAGFANANFFSAAPLACGPYAVRVKLVPTAPAAKAIDPGDWQADMRARLAQGPINYDLQLQFFSDEATTPIEDASVDWPAPYVTVGKLTVTGAGDDAFAHQVESATFDPWEALAAHRPLGEVMRARKVAYFSSQQTRGARN